MIAGVVTTRNEAAIIALTVQHLVSQGVERIYAVDASDDFTPDILHSFYEVVVVILDDGPYHHQDYWVNRLAQQATEDGAEWIIPFDADEFWSGVDGTVAEVLARASTPKVFADVYHYYDWHYREANPKHRKVACRYPKGTLIERGNHDARLPDNRAQGGLIVRELCYRSEDHFLEKVRDRNARLEPELALPTGWQHRRWENLSDDEIRALYQTYSPFGDGHPRNTVLDPIGVA